jgi:glycosyltransferase involved in cell wall biosynthesis
VEIHQVLVGAVHGDAITNEAMQLQPLLRKLGSSEIYSRHVAGGLPSVRLLTDFPAPSPRAAEDVILFHSSIGEPSVDEFLRTRPERLVIRYHNITPASFFRQWEPAFAELLATGREQLAALRDRTTLAIGDSRFNEMELRALGFRHTASVPVLADLKGLLKATPQTPRSVPLPRRAVDPLVLFVGRIAPNKNQAALVQAFHVFKTYIEHDASLALVGGATSENYRRLLESYVRELALPDGVLAGAVSPGELATFYRRASVFVCLSLHEGFCVPLMEAMAFDTPIVALDSSAVGETLGDAGLLLDDASPTLVAEAIGLVLTNSALRQGLVDRGRRRLAELHPSRSGAAFMEQLRQVV